MRETNWLPKIVFVGAVAMFTQSADVGAIASDDTSQHFTPYSYRNVSYAETGLRCYLPVDMGSVDANEPMEVPITKKMVFNFGKPQKMQFAYIED